MCKFMCLEDSKGEPAQGKACEPAPRRKRGDRGTQAPQGGPAHHACLQEPTKREACEWAQAAPPSLGYLETFIPLLLVRSRSRAAPGAQDRLLSRSRNLLDLNVNNPQ